MDCKGQILLYRSFKKYRWNNHKFEIIHVCEPKKLNELEKYYVDLFQCFNSIFGLNLKDGGNKLKLSTESLKKIRDKRLGLVFSEEWRNNMSKSAKGRPKSEEAKAKMRISIKNHPPNRNRLIINIENGIFYCNKKEAADSTYINVWTLKQKLLGYIKNNTPFRYA